MEALKYLIVGLTLVTGLCQARVRIDKEWPGGFEGTLEIQIDSEINNGWQVELRFNQPTMIDTWLGNLYSKIHDRIFVFTNKDWNARLARGSLFEFKFMAKGDVTPSNFVASFFNGLPILMHSSIAINTSEVTSSSGDSLIKTVVLPNLTKGKYDYALVLGSSLLFYEAQRAGKLPPNNRISWRGDSMLMDKGQNGEDLTGGYFDAGDYVKFGFPMAGFTTVLAWGAIEYEYAYAQSGQLDYVRQAIRWATDYFIKAHVSEYEFYGQVGDGHEDHAFWSRPEDWTKQRPAWKITPRQPGSELLAETAAALAAASIVFRSVDTNYQSILLTHARQLYNFANQYRGKYSDSIPNISDFYHSWSGYGDELGWSAAWLLRATGDQRYQVDVETHYIQFGLSRQTKEFSWDDKTAGLQVLMAKITKKQNYRQQAENFCNYVVRQAPRTPKGLVFLAPWGSLRHASNVAFLCLQAAEIGINSQEYLNFTLQQINYMLGDSGRSYVVGFGQNYPKRPHHAASSCPNRPAVCDWNAYSNPNPNPQLLIGALVGGPDQNDNYEDRRDDYVKNEVTTDYNAGFQSAVAGLLYQELKP